MKNKKGFTLIELLAVIIILGVIMLIAIPSVTRSIDSSRKKTYINTVNQFINGATTLVNSGELSVYDTDTTYYIPTKCIPLEKGGESPYGSFDPAYVIVTYNNDSYDFYWFGRDTASIGIKDITISKDLDSKKIETGIKKEEIKPSIGIDNRSKILVLDSSDCVSMIEGQVDNSGNDEEVIDYDNLTYAVVNSNNNEELHIGEPIPDGIRTFTDIEDAFYYFGDDQTVAVILENNIITKAYVGFKYNDETYLIRGGVDETNSSNFKVFNSNKDTILRAFGSELSSYGPNEKWFTGEDVAGGYWYVTTSKDGYTEASRYGFGCFIYNDGTINCW